MLLTFACAGVFLALSPQSPESWAQERPELATASPLPVSLAAEDPAVAHQAGEQGNSDFIDFDHVEAAGRVGFTDFSSRFKSHAEFAGGILARAPMPWFSRQVVGLDHDDFGLFTEVTISGVDRKNLIIPKSSGTTVYFDIGMDYTIYRDDEWLAQAQLGIQYGYFGGVTDLHSGVDALIGVLGGYQFTKGFWATLSPQFAFGHASDFVFFLHIGVMIDF